MGVRTDPERRAELLEGAIDYVQFHGLVGLSLRPLAQSMGTSARMLVYHFGSKQKLIAEALDGVRARQQIQVEKWLSDAMGLEFVGLLRRFWEWSSSAESESYGRLFFEAYGMALIDRERVPGFLDSAVSEWLLVMSSALTDVGVSGVAAEEFATGALALHRGLLLDLLATGDRSRVERAHARLMLGLERDLSDLFAVTGEV